MFIPHSSKQYLAQNRNSVKKKSTDLYTNLSLEALPQRVTDYDRLPEFKNIRRKTLK